MIDVPHGPGWDFIILLRTMLDWGCSLVVDSLYVRLDPNLCKINNAKFKTYDLFISRNLHLIFLDCSWLWVIETAQSQPWTRGGGGYCVYIILLQRIFPVRWILIGAITGSKWEFVSCVTYGIIALVKCIVHVKCL